MLTIKRDLDLIFDNSYSSIRGLVWPMRLSMS